MNYVTYGNGYSAYNSTPSMAGNGIWILVSLIVAICGGIAIYFTFLSPKNKDKYTGNLKALYDFLSFKTMTIESILKICYLVVAIFITLSSLATISSSFLGFLLYLILGNVFARLMFEGSLLIIMIYRRLNDIHEDIRVKNHKDENKAKEK